MSLTDQERTCFKEKATTTISCESLFSRLFAIKGTGDKATQVEIIGMMTRLDSLTRILRLPDKKFTVRESKRKRKYSDTCDVGWNDGIDDKGQYRAEMRRRSKGYVTNRASTRDFNSKFKATGCDRPVAVAPAGAGASAPAPIVAALPYAEL